jgi:hypothetical protein
LIGSFDPLFFSDLVCENLTLLPMTMMMMKMLTNYRLLDCRRHQPPVHSFVTGSWERRVTSAWKKHHRALLL